MSHYWYIFSYEVFCIIAVNKKNYSNIFRKIYARGNAFYEKYKTFFKVCSALYMWVDIGLDISCVVNYYTKCNEVGSFQFTHFCSQYYQLHIESSKINFVSFSNVSYILYMTILYMTRFLPQESLNCAYWRWVNICSI